MKKLSFLILVFVLVFSISGCAKKDEDLSLKKGNSDELEAFSGSIKDLISRGKDLKCTYSVSGIPGQGKMSGTTYISGERSFSQSKISGTDLNMETNVLIDGEYMYTWSSMTPKGTKVNIKKMEELADDEDSLEDYEDYSKAYEEDYNYECSAWRKDDSKFKAPDDIEFMDLTTMMMGMNESMENIDVAGSSESMCSMCDMMSDESQKNECLIGLGCE
jgi:hypothetical protein